MTISGLTALPHGVFGFTSAGNVYSRAGIADGSGDFSALVAVRIVDPTTTLDAFYAGNFDGGGWYLGRAASSTDCVFQFTVASYTVNIPIELSCVLGRTFLLGVSYAGGVARAFLNGAEVASQVVATVASAATMDVGGDSLGTFEASPDIVIGASYLGAALTVDQWSLVWRHFQTYGRLGAVVFDFLWQARILAPQNGVGVPAPATWLNEGAIGAPGDLLWAGVPAFPLGFETDLNPNYVGRVVPTDTILATVAPVNVSKSAALVGVSPRVAREDHKHDADTSAPVQIGAVNAEGAGASLARASHVHALTTTAPAIGAIAYFDGANWERLAAGTVGAVLETRGASAPLWRTPQIEQLYDGAAFAFPTGAPTAITFTQPAPGTTINVTGDGVKQFLLMYRITVSISAVLLGTSGTIQIYDNGVAVPGTLISLGISGIALNVDGDAFSAQRIITLTAGAHALTVRVQRTSGGGSITALLNQRTFQAIEMLGV